MIVPRGAVALWRARSPALSKEFLTFPAINPTSGLQPLKKTVSEQRVLLSPSALGKTWAKASQRAKIGLEPFGFPGDPS